MLLCDEIHLKRRLQNGESAIGTFVKLTDLRFRSCWRAGRSISPVEDLLNQILPKKPLHAYGVTEADLEEFTRSVMETQGRLMGNNFVPLDAARVLKIYTELY